VTAREHRKASKIEKGRILSTLVKQTKLNRVYAGWLLRAWGKKVWFTVDGQPVRLVVGAPRKRRAPCRPRLYDHPVAEAVKKVWYLFDFMCGKRLAVVLRTTADTLVELGELNVSSAVRRKLSRISPATIDRLLAGEKKKLRLKGRSLTKPGTLLKHQIPIRTFSQWDEKKAGFLEIDTVGHEGGDAHGDFALTLDATDVATGWTEMRAVRNKARRWALDRKDRERRAVQTCTHKQKNPSALHLFGGNAVRTVSVNSSKSEPGNCAFTQGARMFGST
jgi:hypothetical protein